MDGEPAAQAKVTVDKENRIHRRRRHLFEDLKVETGVDVEVIVWGDARHRIEPGSTFCEASQVWHG
jgi:hypothetical protein